MSIYTDMIEAGIETDHYESDLYVPDCPTARAILANHGKAIDGWNVQPFCSAIDDTTWLDIPGEYDPYWQARQAGGVA